MHAHSYIKREEEHVFSWKWSDESLDKQREFTRVWAERKHFQQSLQQWELCFLRVDPISVEENVLLQIDKPHRQISAPHGAVGCPPALQGKPNIVIRVQMGKQVLKHFLNSAFFFVLSRWLDSCEINQTCFLEGCRRDGFLAKVKGFDLDALHAGEHYGKASIPLLVLPRRLGARATGCHCKEEQTNSKSLMINFF